jgi:hypothetical protein
MNGRRASVVLGALLGCGGDPTGSIVVGLTSDLDAGTAIDGLAVTMSVDGEVLSERELALGPGSGRTDFPAELAFRQVEDFARVSVGLRALEGPVLHLTRSLETEGVDGAELLARVHLEGSCDVAPSGSAPPGPACSDPAETCVAGRCVPSFVPSSALEPYRPDWATTFADACKPAAAGAPEIIVGLGMSDYLPADDYAVAQVEAGPQGGHHVWVAARVKNLHRSGSITTLAGDIPDLGLTLEEIRLIFTMEVGEGGYCNLHGLRFWLDAGGQEIEAMLGHALRVRVSITDIDGSTGSSEKWITLSNDIL